MISIEKTILSVYFALIKMSEANKIFTHLTYREKFTLNIISRRLKGKGVAVEIGSYLGASSNFIASGLNKRSKLYCIDTWGNDAMIYSKADKTDDDVPRKETYNAFRKNTRKYGKKIFAIKGNSSSAINKLKKEKVKIDFIFIDGDHRYKGIKKDWKLYSPLLSSEAYIAFHDTGWAKGVNKVIKEDVLKVARRYIKLPNLNVYRLKKT